MNYIFQGRNIIIATKHQKEKVIAPLLTSELGLNCIVPESLDTDEFGTFSGEIERADNPIDTARKKCLKAIEISGCDIAIANEGSFNMHPTIYFAHADYETILIYDKKNNFEFFHHEISTNTNFNGSEITSYEELEHFAEIVKFPSHAIILRKDKDSKDDIYKGISSHDELKRFYFKLNKKYSKVYAETDMRAMFNPTRMTVIKEALIKLIAKIKTPCPECNTPGFSVKEYKPGLPCENCGALTRSTLLHIYACQTCNHQEEIKYPHHKRNEDPMYCDFCNP